MVIGTVTNTGDADGRNVVVRFRLVDEGSGVVRSTQTEFIARFGVGEQKQFTKHLDGDCDRTCYAEIETEWDIS